MMLMSQLFRWCGRCRTRGEQLVLCESLPLLLQQNNGVLCRADPWGTSHWWSRRFKSLPALAGAPKSLFPSCFCFLIGFFSSGLLSPDGSHQLIEKEKCCFIKSFTLNYLLVLEILFQCLFVISENVTPWIQIFVMSEIINL